MFRQRPRTTSLSQTTHSNTHAQTHSSPLPQKLRMILIKLLIKPATRRALLCLVVKHTHTSETHKDNSNYNTTFYFHYIVFKAKLQINKEGDTCKQPGSQGHLITQINEETLENWSVTKIIKYNRRLYACTIIGSLNGLEFIDPLPLSTYLQCK